MKLVTQIIITAFLLSVVTVASADKYHPHPHTVPEVTVPVTLDVNEVTNVNDIANYTYDDCQSVAIGQAAASAQMYFGTNKPQISLGMGECGGDWAGSLRGGMKLRNNLMFNGAWSFDEDVNAFGLGATFIFK
jgi:hypothetical protein